MKKIIIWTLLLLSTLTVSAEVPDVEWKVSLIPEKDSFIIFWDKAYTKDWTPVEDYQILMSNYSVQSWEYYQESANVKYSDSWAKINMYWEDNFEIWKTYYFSIIAIYNWAKSKYYSQEVQWALLSSKLDESEIMKEVIFDEIKTLSWANTSQISEENNEPEKVAKEAEAEKTNSQSGETITQMQDTTTHNVQAYEETDTPQEEIQEIENSETETAPEVDTKPQEIDEIEESSKSLTEYEILFQKYADLYHEGSTYTQVVTFEPTKISKKELYTPKTYENLKSAPPLFAENKDDLVIAYAMYIVFILAVYWTLFILNRRWKLINFESTKSKIIS